MATQRRKKSSRDDADEAPVRKKKSSSGTSRRTRSSRESSSTAGVIPIDFSKDESEGGRKRYPEGDYAVKYTKYKTGRSKDKDTPYVRVYFIITEGKYKGQEFSDELYLTDKSLWRIRGFLEAMGVAVPKKKVSVNFKKYIGKTLGVTLSDDEYNKRIRSRVSDFLDEETLRGADEDDDEDFDEDAEDEEEEDTDEDDDEEDEDEDDEDEDDMEEMDVDDDL